MTRRAAERGPNTSFVYELDGLYAIHLGDIGHVLTEQMLGEIGSVQVACIPIGGALSPARAAELVAGLDANLVVPMPLGDEEQRAHALERFLKEMSVTDPQPVRPADRVHLDGSPGDHRGGAGAARSHLTPRRWPVSRDAPGVPPVEAPSARSG